MESLHPPYAAGLLEWRKKMSRNGLRNTSKFISLILRHRPEAIGISLDEHGWADVRELITGVNRSGGHSLSMESLEEIVRTRLLRVKPNGTVCSFAHFFALAV